MTNPFYDPALRAEALARYADVVVSGPAANVPVRYQAARLADVARVHGPAVHRPLADWCLAPSGGLVLLGPTGTGKTYAAVAAAHAIVLHWRSGLRFIRNVDLLDGLRPGGHLHRSDLTAVGLLVLDDVGADRVTDWSAEQVGAVIDERWTAGRPTILTTNLDPADAATHVGARAWSRLTDSGSLALRLSGPDLRKQPPA